MNLLISGTLKEKIKDLSISKSLIFSFKRLTNTKKMLINSENIKVAILLYYS